MSRQCQLTWLATNDIASQEINPGKSFPPFCGIEPTTLGDYGTHSLVPSMMWLTIRQEFTWSVSGSDGGGNNNSITLRVY